jgi:TDG/mug DNA glycosylase family protein
MVLPDVIRPGLRVVFCGTAVGAASAMRGAYYAGPGNKFWRTLHEVGMTPRRLEPAEYASVVQYGIGLTDLCKTQSGSDAQVGRRGFDVQRLDDIVRDNAPCVIAFNGVSAGRIALGGFQEYGMQRDRFGGVEAWVLPSTSGAASGWWDIRHWRDLADRLLSAPSLGDQP